MTAVGPLPAARVSDKDPGKEREEKSGVPRVTAT